MACLCSIVSRASAGKTQWWGGLKSSGGILTLWLLVLVDGWDSSWLLARTSTVWHGLGFHILVARYSGVCLYIRLRTAAANLLKRDIPQNKISTLNMAKHQGEKIRITEFSPENSISKAPSGTSDKEPACQCKRCKRLRFNPWVGKIP